MNCCTLSIYLFLIPVCEVIRFLTRYVVPWGLEGFSSIEGSRSGQACILESLFKGNEAGEIEQTLNNRGCMLTAV